MTLPRPAALLLAALLAGGCAGGWRNGPPPGSGEATSPVIPPAPGAPAGAAIANVNAADSVRFTWRGEGTSVAVAGEFNAWSPTADPMTRGADGSWTLAKKLAPGRYQYKFAIDGGASWKEDPAAAESVSDPYGGKNSVVVVGGATGAPPPVAAAAPAAGAPGAGPRTTTEGTVFTYQGEAKSVALAGDFNAWSTSADLLTQQADGSWRIVKKLEPGRYEYKFALDGGASWKEDPAAAEFKSDPYGGRNSVVVVGAAGTGGAASQPPAPAAPAPAPPVTGTPRAPFQEGSDVTFTYAGPASSRVHLAGDFNGWSTTRHPMARNANGTWTAKLTLAPGSYQYRFLVDGTTWTSDDANPQHRDDPLGGRNSVVTVK